jgi:hypothetical protein
MQPTTCLHDGIANTVFHEASLVLDHTVAFHPANRVCDPAAQGRERPSSGFLCWGEFSPRGLFLGLDARDPLARIALEPQILSPITATGAGIAFALSQAVSMGLPVRGRTQETKMTSRLGDEEGFERRALLLTAIVVLLIRLIGWAVERSVRTRRPTRGARGTPGGRVAARLTAHSAAVRAGRRSWWAKA